MSPTKTRRRKPSWTAQQLMTAKRHAASNARAAAQRTARDSACQGNQAQIDHQRGIVAMVEAQQRRKAEAAAGKAPASDPRELDRHASQEDVNESVRRRQLDRAAHRRREEEAKRRDGGGPSSPHQ
jgi:hypothetical protein